MWSTHVRHIKKKEEEPNKKNQWGKKKASSWQRLTGKFSIGQSRLIFLSGVRAEFQYLSRASRRCSWTPACVSPTSAGAASSSPPPGWRLSSWSWSPACPCRPRPPDDCFPWKKKKKKNEDDDVKYDAVRNLKSKLQLEAFSFCFFFLRSFKVPVIEWDAGLGAFFITRPPGWALARPRQGAGQTPSPSSSPSSSPFWTRSSWSSESLHPSPFPVRYSDSSGRKGGEMNNAHLDARRLIIERFIDIEY